LTVPQNNGAVKTAPYEKMQSEIPKMRRGYHPTEVSFAKQKTLRGITRQRFLLQSKKTLRGITRQRFLLQSKKTLRGDKNILDF